MTEPKEPSLLPCLAQLLDADCSRKPWPWVRELSAAVKGADSWKPSADHTPHSREACPSFKGDLNSTSPHAPPQVKRQTMNFDRYGHTSRLSLLSLTWKNSLTAGNIFISGRWHTTEQQWGIQLRRPHWGIPIVPHKRLVFFSYKDQEPCRASVVFPRELTWCKAVF